ncbi:Superoxide dismutase [Cu-Zn] [Gaertneriomyces sp. JEL0708]|nr:Superoxide dismutase [Cu-Zn] [Gaertneriomyces sp. JEL0708]
MSPIQAVAVLRGDTIKDVHGTVIFEQSDANGPVKIQATIHNLPAGEHGFHIHEFGDLTNGCTSAGAHYNPTNTTHGAPKDPADKRHVGDFGNITSTGVEKPTIFALKDHVVKLTGPYSIIGRSIVVHEGQDDLGKNPDNPESLKNGNAGPRAACGVIGVRK